MRTDTSTDRRPSPWLIVYAAAMAAAAASGGTDGGGPAAEVPASQAIRLQGDSLVLGAVRNGKTRAYPLSMMTFHHVVNDT